MIRKLMASTAVFALMSAGAFTIAQAQTDEPANPVIAQDQATTAPATTELAASEQVLTPDQPTFATVYIGRSVYSSEDPESDNIGDVNDLIVSEDGTITHAVIGVGGFLGIGEKDVAVPFDELKVVEKDGDIRLIYSSTREQLEAAPALDRTAFDPTARAAAEQSASTDTGAGSLAPAPTDQLAAPAAEESTAATAPADTTQPAEPAQETAAAPKPDEAAPAAREETAATAPADTAQPAEPAQETAAAPKPDEAAPAEEETAATAPADTTKPAEQETAASTESTDQNAVAPAQEEVAANAPAAATEAPAEDLTAAPAAEDTAANTEETKPAASGDVQFVTASADQVQASDLLGKSVFGAENESIGEISDLILEKEGKTRVALIDVGGFLGVGEKTVAIPFDQLQISKAEDGSEQVKVAMSKDQLEQLPAVEKEAAAATPVAPATGEQPADQMAAAPATEQPAALATGEQPAEQTAAAPAEPATTTEQPAETAANAPATDEVTTGSINQPAEFAVATQDIPASKLIGATVYGPDDANLGEVGDVLFTKTGDIDAAVIDVGGFLGIGEKPVALEFGNLNVRSDENGTLTVMVNATQDQLDQAPTFEEPAEASVQ